MDSWDEACKRADERYRRGKEPTAIDPGRWDRAREAKRWADNAPAWERPGWELEELWYCFQRRAEQRRIREKAKRPRRRPLVP